MKLETIDSCKLYKNASKIIFIIIYIYIYVRYIHIYITDYVHGVLNIQLKMLTALKIKFLHPVVTSSPSFCSVMRHSLRTNMNTFKSRSALHLSVSILENLYAL
jgi:hypothetical protein